MHSKLELIPASDMIISSPNGAKIINGSDTNDSFVNITIPEFSLTDQNIFITYAAKLKQNIEANEEIITIPSISYDSSPDNINGNDGREYTSNTKIILTTSDETILSEPLPIATSIETNSLTAIAVGVTISYNITMTFIEGTLDNTELEIKLPSGLAYIASNIIYGNHITTELDPKNPSIVGNYITMNFGTLINTYDNVGPDENDQIIITIDLIAKNIASNVNNALLSGMVTLTHSKDISIVKPLLITIVAPELIINSSMDIIKGDAFDDITYTLILKHNNRSTSNAYDIYVMENLDSLYTLKSVEISHGIDQSINDLNVFIPIYELDDTEDITITYVVTVSNDIVPNDIITNNINVVYDSSPFNINGNKGKSFFIQDQSLVFNANMRTWQFNNTFDSSIDTTYDNIVSIGEYINFNYSLSIPEGTNIGYASNLKISFDVASIHADIIDSRRHFNDNIDCSLMNSLDTGNTLNTFATKVVTFDLGTVINNGDNLINDNDLIIISIQTLILDTDINKNSTEIDFKAIFTDIDGHVTSIINTFMIGEVILLLILPLIKN